MRCKKDNLNLFAYRLTHWTGSWQCQRSTWLSAMWELLHPILPIFCQGQCNSMEAPAFKCSFSIWIRLELERLELALEPSSIVSIYHVFLSSLTDKYCVIVAPIDNCEMLKYVQGVFSEIGVPATSLLFFFRLKAIYMHSRIIITIFGIFWLAIAGLTILIMLSIVAGE